MPLPENPTIADLMMFQKPASLVYLLCKYAHVYLSTGLFTPWKATGFVRMSHIAPAAVALGRCGTCIRLVKARLYL